MNFRSLFTRTIQVPESNETRSVEVPRLWFVRWKSGSSVYIGNPRVEAECFLSEAEAISFKESLINALKLLRYREGDGSDRRSGNCPYAITIETQTTSNS